MFRTVTLLFLLTGCAGDGGKGDGPGAGGDDTGAPGDTGSPPDAEDGVDALGLVPLPASVELGEGTVVLDDTTTLWATGEAVAVASLLAEELAVPSGLPLTVQDGDGAGSGAADLVLAIDDSIGGPEAYTLTVDEAGVRLTGADRDGLFWATRTLLQLLPPAVLAPSLQATETWELPMVTISDSPTHSWRGGMIDVARHFYDVDQIKRQIDLFALHKLNRLHLHLTDDQGWRIEILSWPDLAIIGGATEVGGGAGGYYTQDDYVELVLYAEQRGIVVIPEIDFPGHANAARSAYPELNSDGEPVEPYTGQPVITTPLDLEAPATYEMVEDVWTEVAALTPGPWVHVGGDEAIDLSQPEYADFMQWLHGVIDDQGKLLIGWDEIGEGELSPPYISQYWWQRELVLDVADSGAQFIYSWASYCYLDMAYDNTTDLGQTWAGRVNTFTAYKCRPALAGVDSDRWLGVEAPLWTEYVATEDEVDAMLWPRLAAVAENGWSPREQLDWDSFQYRVGRHGHRLDAVGVAYHRGIDIDWTVGSP
jgi:hexosaminidase